jgi:hypothetical protein
MQPRSSLRCCFWKPLPLNNKKSPAGFADEALVFKKQLSLSNEVPDFHPKPKKRPRTSK